ncbi:hypothetical protein ARMGADRAFT_1035831 [Armillaria gallica]|uniref:Uncharacterized protein n=1 Tax=Armillaria gallica TaxID=47427 RepID=A0A2H3D3Y7_ARMGA|nr:hypothetical protein ARMGADRAFT_1035831 [Armillaria gallica]
MLDVTIVCSGNARKKEKTPNPTAKLFCGGVLVSNLVVVDMTKPWTNLKNHVKLNSLRSRSRPRLFETGNGMTFWSNEDGICSRAVTEAVHANLTNANFGGRIKRTREDSCNERLTAVVHLPITQYPYGGGTLAEDGIGTSNGTTSRKYFGNEHRRKGGEMEVGVAVAPSTQLKKSCEGGCIKSDGAGADEEDGGRDCVKKLFKLALSFVVNNAPESQKQA